MDGHPAIFHPRARLVAMAGHGARSFRAGIMIEHRRLSSSPLRGEVAPKAPERAGTGDIADYTRVLELYFGDMDLRRWNAARFGKPRSPARSGSLRSPPLPEGERSS